MGQNIVRRAHEALNTQCIIHKLKLYGLVHEQGHVGIPGGPFKIYTPLDLDLMECLQRRMAILDLHIVSCIN